MNRFQKYAALTLFAALSTVAQANAQWYQGPSGGLGGEVFDGWVANNHSTNIRQILVLSAKSDGTLQCIVVSYPTQSGAVFAGASGPHNCNVGNTSDEKMVFNLNPNEYVLGISGTYSDHICSLRFYTNNRNSPVYGNGSACAPFGYTAPIGEGIVAFTQTNDARLRSIGVMYAPCDSKLKACR